MYEMSNISTALQYPDPTLVRIRDNSQVVRVDVISLSVVMFIVLYWPKQ